MAPRTIIVRSPCNCRTMTAQYLCHFKGTARASCHDLAIAVRVTYDHRKSLQSSCDFLVPKRPAKTLHSPHYRRATTVRCPCGDRAMLLRCVYGLRFYDFKFFAKFRVKQNHRGYDNPWMPKNHTISYDLRTEIARKWEFRHCTITVSSS